MKPQSQVCCCVPKKQKTEKKPLPQSSPNMTLGFLCQESHILSYCYIEYILDLIISM